MVIAYEFAISFVVYAVLRLRLGNWFDCGLVVVLGFVYILLICCFEFSEVVAVSNVLVCTQWIVLSC